MRALAVDNRFSWLVTGDFNEILFSHEKCRGRLRWKHAMEDFQMTLDDCRLQDIGYMGYWFTCERGRLVGNNIREKLDRGVVTVGWRELFPQVVLKNCSLHIESLSVIS